MHSTVCVEAPLFTETFLVQCNLSADSIETAQLNESTRMLKGKCSIDSQLFPSYALLIVCDCGAVERKSS